MSLDRPFAWMRDVVPAGAYREDLVVRSFEVGRDGRASPATLLRYLEHLATRASAAVGYDNMWYERHGQAWVIHEMDLLLGRPPHMNDAMGLATWVSAFRRVQAFRECAAWSASTGQRVARARGRWGYIDRATMRVVRVPEEIIRDCPVFTPTLAPRTRPEAARATTGEKGGQAAFDLVARSYEADSQRHINNCMYVDWLAEALYRALPSEARADWWPRYFHLEYLRPMWPGDAARVHTDWALAGQRLLVVAQEVTNGDGALALRAWSSHVRVLAADSAD